jgi:hypothetical protein
MGRKRQSRIYQKGQRWYGDFRDFKDVGGKQEALVAPGERYATDDEEVALKPAEARILELERLRKSGYRTRPDVDLTRLGDFVDYHRRVSNRGENLGVSGGRESEEGIREGTRRAKRVRRARMCRLDRHLRPPD